ncbi:MAG: hypothetical protein K8T89_20045 [Planctomycetes bacterium]|nr:hypothetical protein [Planctomycetota bacterium]
MQSSPLLRLSRFVIGGIAFAFVCWLSRSDAQAPKVPTPGVFSGHQEAIYSIALSPDGKILATSSFDKSVKLWDMKSGKELRVFTGTNGHQNIVLNVTFSPMGDTIASGGSDNTARVWDIPMDSALKDYVHAAGVAAVAVTVDGKLLAGACKDGTVKLWTTVDGKQIFNLVGHPGGATGVAFSANGQLLVSSGVDSTLRYWNPVTGLPIATVGAHASGVNGVALFPNNTSAASIGEDGFLKWWLLPPVLPRALPSHTDAVTALGMSADGATVLSAGADKMVKQSTYATGALVKDFPGAGVAMNTVISTPTPPSIVGGGSDGKLHVWTTADAKLVAQIPAHVGGVTGSVLHPSQPILATVGADGNLKTWAWPVAGTRTYPTPDKTNALAMIGDGKRFYTAGADKIVRSGLLATGALDRQFTGHTAPVTAIAVSPDNNVLVSAGADDTIRFWNTTNSMQTAQISGHVGGINSLALAGTLLVSAGEDGTVKLWQLPVVAVKPFAHPDAVNGMVLSSDGNRLLTIGNDKQVRLWNITSGQIERNHPAGAGAISAAAVGPDNVTLAVAGADKSLTTWNAGKEVKKFPPLPSAASAVAFSPTKPEIAVALADNSIRLLNSADTKEIKNIPGHTGAISAIVYSPKGDLFLSASADKSIRLWSAADGAAKGAYTHSGPISALAIAKDGTRIAAGGTDKSIGIWTLADGKPATPIVTPAEIRGLSFSPDGLKIAAAGSDGKVRIYGIDGKLQEIFNHDGPATGVAFLPDGKRVFSSSADKTARLWTSSFIAQGTQVGPVRQVLISPRVDQVFSVGDDKNLHIWDAKTAKEVKSIPAHTGPVLGLGLSTDVTKVVTVSADKTAKVWTLADAKAVATIALTGVPQAVALTPNAAKVAIAFADPANKVRLYETVGGKELQALAEPTAPVRSLTFLIDNRTLVSAGDDKQISVLDAAATSVHQIHAGGAVGVVYHPTGTQTITAGKDKTVRLWDLTAGKEVKALGTLADPINALAVSRDTTLVGAGGGKIVKIWQIADGKAIATLNHPAEVSTLSFNADKTRVVTGATDNLARVWEVATGRLMQTYSHGAAVKGALFHPTLPFVVTASADKTVAVQPQTFTRQIEASKMPLRAMAVTTAGTQIITAGDDKNAKMWNATTGAEEKNFPGAEGPIYAVAVNKTTQLIATAGADKTIRLYTYADTKLLGSIPAGAVVRGLAFHPTLPILVSVADNQAVTAWNIATVPAMPLPPEFGKPIQEFVHPQIAAGLVFQDPTGALYTAGGDKNIKQWRIASDSAVRNLVHPNLVDCVAFDPTGKMLATGCHDGILRIFDIEKNLQPPIKSINAHTLPQPNQIYSVLWSNDGKQLLTASYDKSLKLWDYATGNMVREFKPYTEKTFVKGHHDQVFCAAFTKDGKFLASGGSDKMIKLWNVADGSVVREFENPKIKQLPPPESPEAHPGWVYSVCFVNNDKYLVSVGSAPKNQGFLAVWNVADGKMLYSQEMTNGPIYSVVPTKDGTQLILGCGPRDRQNPVSDAITVPMPVK